MVSVRQTGTPTIAWPDAAERNRTPRKVSSCSAAATSAEACPRDRRQRRDRNEYLYPFRSLVTVPETIARCTAPRTYPVPDSDRDSTTSRCGHTLEWRPRTGEVGRSSCLQLGDQLEDRKTSKLIPGFLGTTAKREDSTNTVLRFSSLPPESR
jgi:hypothetical protein